MKSLPSMLLPVLVALWPLAPQTAPAQLVELSKGDKVAKWQSAQLAEIQQQLEDPSTPADLKAELQAQKTWLSSYKPGSLAKTPTANGSANTSAMKEPIVDPSGLAAPHRQKLLAQNAAPTTEDTENLQAAIQQHPDDIGLRQLQLQWMDQPQYRKDYSAEIVRAAQRLLGLIANLEAEEATQRALRAHTLYRLGRAIVYRELPDVVQQAPLSDEQREALDTQLTSVFLQLQDLVGSGRPEFILLEDRMLRRDGWLGRALELLERHGSAVELHWYLKKRRDLLRELNWEAPADEAAAIYAEAFPERVAEEQAAVDSQ